MYSVLLFIFSLCCYSQSYRLIEKAEKNFELHEYSKALKQLKKAENADYGFCGTAKIEALLAITELRFKIYKEINKPKEFESFLNDIDPFFELSAIYSVERLKLARLRFEDSDLSNSIISSLQTVDNDELYEFGNIIPLKINDSYTLKLFFKSDDIREIQKTENLTYNEALIKHYKNSIYYTLLNDN